MTAGVTGAREFSTSGGDSLDDLGRSSTSRKGLLQAVERGRSWGTCGRGAAPGLENGGRHDGAAPR